MTVFTLSDHPPPPQFFFIYSSYVSLVRSRVSSACPWLLSRILVFLALTTSVLERSGSGL